MRSLLAVSTLTRDRGRKSRVGFILLALDVGRAWSGFDSPLWVSTGTGGPCQGLLLATALIFVLRAVHYHVLGGACGWLVVRLVGVWVAENVACVASLATCSDPSSRRRVMYRCFQSVVRGKRCIKLQQGVCRFLRLASCPGFSTALSKAWIRPSFGAGCSWGDSPLL